MDGGAQDQGMAPLARLASTKSISARGSGSPRKAIATSATANWRDTLLPYVLEMGYTHIELLPVAEHPFDGSWGYQVTGYFAPDQPLRESRRVPLLRRSVPSGRHRRDPRLGARPFSERPARPRANSTAPISTSTPIRARASTRDWGTLIFNYGRNEVRNFLIANALFWLDEYHIDGLRVDAVASMLYLDYSRKPGEWIPNIHGGRENLEAIYFLKRFNEVCYERHPGIMTIAEESTAWPGVSRPTYLGGLGFGFKWNMGWMHDFLDYMALDPDLSPLSTTATSPSRSSTPFTNISSSSSATTKSSTAKARSSTRCPATSGRSSPISACSTRWMYRASRQEAALHGRRIRPVARMEPRQLARLAPLRARRARRPQAPRASTSTGSTTASPRSSTRTTPTKASSGSTSTTPTTPSSPSCAAVAHGEVLVFVVNATPVVREGYRLGVPGAGWYEEILNTDAQTYGGSNVGNLGGQWAERHPLARQTPQPHGHPPPARHHRLQAPRGRAGVILAVVRAFRKDSGSRMA